MFRSVGGTSSKQLLSLASSRRFLASKPSNNLPGVDLNELARIIPEETSTASRRSGALYNENELDWSHLKDEDSQGKLESDTFSADESGRTEQKEEMIFKEVLSHVLSNPSRPTRTNPLRSNSTPSTSATSSSSSSPSSPSSQLKSNTTTTTPLADSILALFDKSNSTSQRTEQNRSPGVASLMDGLLHPKMEPSLSPEELKKREIVNEKLSLVIEHIENLPTNREVMNYFESVILPRFDPFAKLSEEKTDPYKPEDVLVGPDTASILLEKSIVVLTKDFKDPLGALHLFEISKHHSIDFFSEACSAEVYNQIIRIKWYDYRDLYAVVNLAAEIAINAIPPTLETTELLSKIYRDAYDSSKGMGSTPYGMPLWTGQDIRRLEELNRYRTRFQTSWAAKPVLRF